MQAFAVLRFLFHYPIPLIIFAYCYGRIFHTVRRQNKVVGGLAGQSHNVAMVTVPRDQNPGQVQQQATGATTGAKLSRAEMNVLKTMIAVIVCFVVFWSVREVSNLLQLLEVSTASQQFDTSDYSVVQYLKNK